MKILYILDYFYPHVGGAEKMFFDLCFQLSQKGIEVIVATSKVDEKDFLEVNKNFLIYYFNWKNLFGHPFIKIKDLERFKNWPDIIHTATYTSAYFAYKFAKKNNKKIVLTVYEYLGNDWFLVEKNYLKSNLFFLFENYVVHKNYDLFHAISFYTKKQLVNYGIPADKIKVIYPVFQEETKNIKVIDKDSKIKLPKNYFLYYGRPGKTKGIFILYEAFKKLILSKKNFSLVYILSDYPKNEKEKLIRLIRKEKLEKSVFVLNSMKKDDLTYIIGQAFAVVIPSLTEGFGFSAYESSLMKKRIIVSKTCSLPEVVFGRVLFFERNNINDLFKKLNLAVENRFLEIKKDRNKFDYRRNINEMNLMYKRLLNK